MSTRWHFDNNVERAQNYRELDTNIDHYKSKFDHPYKPKEELLLMSYKAMADAHQLGTEIRNFLERNRDDSDAINELQAAIQVAYLEKCGVVLREEWQQE